MEKQNESVSTFKIGKKIDSADISFEDCETLFGRPIAEALKCDKFKIYDKNSTMTVFHVDPIKRVITFKSE